MIRRILVLSATYGSLILFAGCAAPPNLSPTADQVPDVNETLTQAKDANWALYEWPTVDDFIVGGNGTIPALVPPNGDGGCAVGLAEQGEILYLGVYGTARSGQAWNYGTVAPVGSIAKSLTALAAMSLTQMDDPNGDPYLVLSDEVGEVLTTLNSTLSPLRADSMLAHLSGVGGNSLAKAAAPNWAPETPVADCALMGDATACPDISQLLAYPSFAYSFYEPVEVVESVSATNGMYSNVGYTILGAMIDEVTSNARGLAEEQRGYEKFVWDRLANWTGVLDGRRMLSPALSHSWRVADNDFLRYARGFPDDLWEALASDDPALGATAEIEGWEGPSGGWAMSIGDLTRFATLFPNDTFIPDNVHNAMVQSLSQPLGNSNSFRWYGYGVFSNEDPNGVNTEGNIGTVGGAGSFKRWYHGGDIGSHSAYWAHWPSVFGSNYSMALICNNVSGNSLNTLEPAMFWLLTNALRVPDDRPSLKTTIGFLPSTAQMHRAVYDLDFSTAWFTSPRHLFLPLNEIDPLAMQLIAGDVSGAIRLAVQHPRRRGTPTVVRGLIDHDKRELRSRPADVALFASGGRAVLRDAEFRFAFSEDQNSLVGLTLNGTLDTRDLVGLAIVDDWHEACVTARELGAECGSCNDGVRACLTVGMTDIQGRRR